jgi:hypothetical protein
MKGVSAAEQVQYRTRVLWDHSSLVFEDKHSFAKGKQLV